MAGNAAITHATMTATAEYQPQVAITHAQLTASPTTVGGMAQFALIGGVWTPITHQRLTGSPGVWT